MTVLSERPTTPWSTRPGWGISVDLLPREVLEARQVRVHRRLVLLGLVVVVLACVGLVLMSQSDRTSAQRSYDAEQARTTQLRAAAGQYADVTAATAMLKETTAQTSTLMAQDVDVVNLIARIRNAVPAGVTIGNIAVLQAPPDVAGQTTSGGRSVIGTVTVAGGGTQIQDLAAFVANLNHVRGVTDVVPGSTTQSETGLAYALSLNFTDVLYTHRFDQAAGQ